MAEDNETLEDTVAELAKMATELRQDINILGSAIKGINKEVKKVVGGINSDMVSMQKDIEKVLIELSENQKTNESSDYVDLLLSDDLKEREQKLLDEVSQMVKMRLDKVAQPQKRKKFLGIF